MRWSKKHCYNLKRNLYLSKELGVPIWFGMWEIWYWKSPSKWFVDILLWFKYSLLPNLLLSESYSKQDILLVFCFPQLNYKVLGMGVIVCYLSLCLVGNQNICCLSLLNFILFCTCFMVWMVYLINLISHVVL